MKSIIGVLRREKRNIDEEQCKQFQSAVSELFSSKRDTWSNELVSLNSIQEDGKNKRDKLIECDSYTDLIIVGDATIYNKQELGVMLEVNIPIDQNSDLYIILEAYKKWGVNCVHYLNGDFSFAIYNEKEESFFCARDPLGQRPFYYFLDRQHFLFADRMQILSHFSFAEELNENWVVNFLQGLNSYKEETVFKKIKKLKPGYTLLVTKEKETFTSYWKLAIHKKTREANITNAVDGLRSRFNTAVKHRINCNKNVGIELSGGLDSSAVAAFAAKETNGSNIGVSAFTDVLPSSDTTSYGEIDDWALASSVATHLGIEKHHKIEKPPADTLDMLHRTLNILGYPTNFFFSMLQESLYSKARDEDVENLLSGYGGDEMITEFAPFRYTISLMKKGRFRQLCTYYRRENELPIKSYLKAFRAYAKFIWNSEGRYFRSLTKEKWDNVLIQDKIITKKLKNFFFKDTFFSSKESLRQRGISHLTDARFAERLEVGYLTTAAYGLTYRYPLLDIPLIEYYFGLPDAWKAMDKSNRGLMRNVIKDYLPAEITKQPKSKVATIPYYKTEMENNFEKVKDWCLHLPDDHKIFDYIDKRKLDKPSYSIDEDRFDLLRCVAMLAMFFDRMEKRILHDI